MDRASQLRYGSKPATDKGDPNTARVTIDVYILLWYAEYVDGWMG